VVAVPAVAVKVAVVALLATLTDDGTVSRLDEELNETVVAAVTACESVTVHAEVAFDNTVVGVQARFDTTTGAVKLNVVLAELPL